MDGEKATNMEEYQTSETEVEIGEETQTDETEVEETEGAVEAPQEEEIDYKIKFSESSREAQRLLSEKKQADTLLVQREQALAEKESELEEMRNALNSDNPDAGELLNLKKSVASLQKDILLEKEEKLVNEFIGKEPLAAKAKEALKDYGRVYPNKSLNEIWETYFKPLVEQGKTIVKTSPKTETGKGSSSPEPTGGINDNFNKLSLEDRKKHFKKLGL